ncbi:MAG: hypothetical protein ACYCWW_06575, partial [Deltaproteobacteria bacterium]
MPGERAERGFAWSIAWATVIGGILRFWWVLLAHPPASELNGEMMEPVLRAYASLAPHAKLPWSTLLGHGLPAACTLALRLYKDHSVELLSPVQALLATATVPLAAIGLSRFFGSRPAAWAAWLLALDPVAIHQAGLFLPDCYVAFFLALGLALARPHHWKSSLASMLALGLAGWFDPRTFGAELRALRPLELLVPIAVGFAICAIFDSRLEERLLALLPREGARRRLLLCCAAVILGAAFMTAPLWLGTWWANHDWDRYVARLVEYLRGWRDGQLFPRWCPDCYGGFGSPLFDFHPPGVFTPSALLALLGLGLTASIKVTLVLSACLGGLGTFFLVRGESRRSDAALVSAFAFSFAPYQFVNLFLRGDLSEVVALSLFPMTLFLYRECLRAPLRQIPWLGLAAAPLHAGIVL